ncbi:gamma-glutamylcyclotransferase family protein [Rubidibacter lacunae]|uniref:gamma-glutamylcyclotransferase family protein n=1 Tax=Rubidibacter lacunae TaxID=582514 RepID=UPI0004176188|nr:gamma-glutamylcyclotransferase [Rubidibacter lacunae]
MLHVFVYGTLKPGGANYATYCAGKAIVVGRAHIIGQLYDLPLGYPAAIAAGGRIEGYLLAFAHPTSLADLDELEGCNPDGLPTANDYYRKLVKV